MTDENWNVDEETTEVSGEHTIMLNGNEVVIESADALVAKIKDYARTNGLSNFKVIDGEGRSLSTSTLIENWSSYSELTVRKYDKPAK